MRLFQTARTGSTLSFH